METQQATSEKISFHILKNAPLGLIEINQKGEILNSNLAAQAILKYLLAGLNLNVGIDDLNIYTLTPYLDAGLEAKIRNYKQERGRIMPTQHCPVLLTENGIQIEKHYNIDVTQMFPDYYIFAIDDITEKVNKEKEMQQTELDKAVAQSKYELVSEVLHDIGNAVVGFGSYLTRINRMLEQNSLQNLQNLTAFMQAQQTVISTAIGDAKSAALVNLLNGITKTEKENQEELRHSVNEQLNIISHIQEILNIQRQYVTGKENNERKPVNMRSMINDCLAMLSAALEKKGITVSIIALQEPPLIHGDRTKLMQVILNILKNSVEATDVASAEKKIKIKLQTVDDLLSIVIEDNGQGFDAATKDGFFKRGFTTKNTGTGLGLYNCKKIIESHSGSIEIDSAGKGMGAVTTIKLKV